MARRKSKRCRNCPIEDVAPLAPPVTTAAAKAAIKVKGSSLDPLLLTMPSEAAKLWHHILFGTGTCVGMIAGYAALGMPGAPMEQLYALREALSDTIRTLENQHEDRSPRQ